MADQPLMPPEERRESRYSILSVFLVFIVPALGGFLFGFDIGATSYVIVQLQSPVLSGIAWYNTVAASPALQGFIVASASLGGLIGSTLVFGVADYIGRRKELRYGSLLYILGGILEYWTGRSSHWSAGFGIFMLLTGRIIFGIGIGVSMHAAPTYIGEMGPSSIRGLLVSLKEASIVLGMLVGYSIGYVFSTTQGGWANTYASSLLFSLLMLGLSFTIPMSCRWLLLRGREEEALQSLKFVFVDEDAEREFATMKRLLETDEVNLESPSEQEATPAGKSVWDPAYRMPLTVGVGLVVLQQITGQPSVLSYATPIFQDAGLADYASILVAAFKLLATLSAAFSVERFGRKNLLYTGCSLMLVALIVLAFSFGSSSKSVETLILLSMFVYIGGYQVGFGPISWLMTSEIFPLSVRGQAVALAVQMNFLLNALVQVGVPVFQRLIGLSSTFALFAILDAYSIYFVFAYVPETKGLTLEQIERQFAAMRRRSGVPGVTPEMEPLRNAV